MRAASGSLAGAARSKRLIESVGYALGGDEAPSFLQSGFWGDFKAEFGWKPLRLELRLYGDQGKSNVPLLLLVRSLGAGLSFAYTPHGPDLDLPEQERAPFLAELSEALRAFVPRGCLFIRYDPPWYAVEPPRDDDGPEVSGREVEAMRPAIGPPLRRAAADVQPPDTVLVDLRPDEGAMLAAMKAKWRYNIRLAGKKGVKVEEAGPAAIGEFYALYRATSQRDRIALHPELYYSRLFALAAERRSAGLPGSPDLRLWVARHEGQALAAIVTLYRGERAVYLYGASSDENRNLMPAYALQWSAMIAAKSAGCVQYDLFGIPPTGDSSHPMAGLYRFKTGFGGQIAHRSGSWDYPLRPAAYACFRAAEGARSWWYKNFLKRLKGSRRS